MSRFLMQIKSLPNGRCWNAIVQCISFELLQNDQLFCQQMPSFVHITVAGAANYLQFLYVFHTNRRCAKSLNVQMLFDAAATLLLMSILADSLASYIDSNLFAKDSWFFCFVGRENPTLHTAQM